MNMIQIKMLQTTYIFLKNWQHLSKQILKSDVAQGATIRYYDQVNHAKHRRSQRIHRWRLQWANIWFISIRVNIKI